VAYVLVCLFAVGPYSVLADAPNSPVSRLILRLHDDPLVHAASGPVQTTEERLNSILQSLHIEGVVLDRSVDASLVVMRFTLPVSEQQIAEIAHQLESSPEVMYAEPDAWVKRAYTPSDPLIERTRQWFHYDTYGIRAYEAWDLERGDAGVVIALLDTGILPHEDLDPARVLAGYDFISVNAISNDSNGRDPYPTDPGDAVAANECGAGEPAEDSSWHGLHLAGIMTATADNAVGGTGINHLSRLLPVRVLGKCGGSFSDILDGILWSAGLPVSGVPTNTTPAKVINLSFAGTGSCNSAVQDAIDRVVAAGSIVVAAAGNGDGTDIANVFPAGCNNVIAVAATDRSGAVASYSNIGSRVLLSAPGGDGVFTNGIYSTHNTGLTSAGADSYTYFTGTSVASAQVSAAVSLILSLKPALTLNDVRQILSQTAQPYTGGCLAGNCGAGRLDLFAALQLAQTTTPSNPPAAVQVGGGGGGGGCVLQPGAAPRFDGAWVILLLFLGGVWLRHQSTRD
jgi:serine protease